MLSKRSTGRCGGEESGLFPYIIRSGLNAAYGNRVHTADSAGAGEFSAGETGSFQFWLFRTFGASFGYKTYDVCNVLWSTSKFYLPPLIRKLSCRILKLWFLSAWSASPDSFGLYAVTNHRPACPIGGCVSRSRHSCYCRRLQDLPWQGISVQLCVFVHRYRCRNPVCPRKVFCERLPGVARCYARQTDRASEIVRVVGYVSGGRPGQRLLLRRAIEASDDTVLRRVKQKLIEPAEANPIEHLGVDDWAWRKGQNYGTILVDLDLHRVVDLLRRIDRLKACGVAPPAQRYHSNRTWSLRNLRRRH